MKQKHLLWTGLGILGCQDKTSTQNEAELRALRVEIATLRTELDKTRTSVQQNTMVTEEWEDDVAALWTAVIQNQNDLVDLVDGDWIADAIEEGAGPIGELAERVEELENSYGDAATVLTSTAALAEKVMVTPDGDVVFYDTNVLIQNGTGSTDTVNGKGNLVVGYSRLDGSMDRGGSHNVVVGDFHDFTGHSSVVAGTDNQVTASNAVAIGGMGARVTADYAVTVGGLYNAASAQYAAALGGGYNSAAGANSVAVGGYNNTAAATFSMAAGGQINEAAGDYAMVAGGTMHAVEGEAETIAGGYLLVDGEAFSVSMIDGLDGIVDALYSEMDDIALDLLTSNADQDFAIIALQDTTEDAVTRIEAAESSITENSTGMGMLADSLTDATADLAVLSTGTEAQAAHLDDLEGRVQSADEFLAFVTIDGMDNVVFSGTNILINNGTGETTEPNGKGNLFLGYNAYEDEVRTGSHNLIIGDHNAFSATAGLIVGDHHQVMGHGSAVIGGEQNILNGDGSVILAGYTSDVSSDLAVAVGGAHNTVAATYGLALGGYNNAVLAEFATAGGGQENVASGGYALAMGGALNIASGESSTVAGGYSIESMEALGMGATSLLEDTVTDEQRRLDDALGVLAEVETTTEVLQSYAEEANVHLATLDSAVLSLQEFDAAHDVRLNGTELELADLSSRLSAMQTDMETADASLEADILALQATDSTLSSSIEDSVSGLPALSDRISTVETNDEVQSSRLAVFDVTISEMESDIAANRSDVESVASRTTSTEAEIADIDDHVERAEQLLTYVSVNDTGDVTFTGTNVLIQNGSEETTMANEKGNLIIGYNATSSGGLERTGSHNLIIGDGHSFTSTGGLITGDGNTLSGANSAIIAGSGHTVSGATASAISGANNTVLQTGAVAAGGQFNTLSGAWSAAIAGTLHDISGHYSAVLGGHTGTISGERGALVGGYLGQVTANQATVLGGHSVMATEAFGVAPIDTLTASVDSVEDFTATLGDSVAEDIAANTGRIDDLETDTASLNTRVTTNTSDISDVSDRVLLNTADISGLEGDVVNLNAEDETLWASIDDLDGSRDIADHFLSYVSVSGGGDLVFEDTNLIVRNSSGNTAEADGKGNIIIGYNEMDDDDIRTGSHNLIIGSHHSYAASGGIVAGQDNLLSGDFGSVLGGTSNAAAGDRSVVIAGQDNLASGDNAVVVAGYVNQAVGQGSVVLTGTSNTASGIYSAVLAGSSNEASGAFSGVVAGEQGETSGQSAGILSGLVNVANARNSAVVAGKQNTADYSTSAILAGWLNRTGADYAAVVSGYDNDADGAYSSVAGGFKNHALHSGSVVVGEYTDSTGLYAFDQ